MNGVIQEKEIGITNYEVYATNKCGERMGTRLANVTALGYRKYDINCCNITKYAAIVSVMLPKGAVSQAFMVVPVTSTGMRMVVGWTTEAVVDATQVPVATNRASMPTSKVSATVSEFPFDDHDHHDHHDHHHPTDSANQKDESVPTNQNQGREESSSPEFLAETTESSENSLAVNQNQPGASDEAAHHEAQDQNKPRAPDEVEDQNQPGAQDAKASGDSGRPVAIVSIVLLVLGIIASLVLVYYVVAVFRKFLQKKDIEEGGTFNNGSSEKTATNKVQQWITKTKNYKTRVAFTDEKSTEADEKGTNSEWKPSPMNLS